MSERVLSVNVGLPIEVPYGSGTVRTGIFKSPVEGRVAVRRSGLDGDGQADTRVHGGDEKAVYLYSWDSYLWWAEQLGHRLSAAELGENLTVTGLTDDVVHCGDRLRAGSAVLVVTGPREPCAKLGIRVGDARFVERFRNADRMGFYARVAEEGAVGAGDEVERVGCVEGAPSIAEIHRLHAHARDDVAALRELATAPAVPESWRAWMRVQADRAEAGAG